MLHPWVCPTVFGRHCATVTDRRCSKSQLMELFWWLITIVLFAVGLLGTVVPFLPGTTIILAGAIIHRVMLGADKSIGWTGISILILLTLLSYGSISSVDTS